MELLDQYLARLKQPARKARPYTRWWWYGASVEKREIKRELNFIKEAGLGGVELQILYPLDPDHQGLGGKNIPYNSPEFFEIIDYTISEAELLGLEFDMTLSSSWPFGGSFVPADMAPESLIPYQFDIHGPTRYSQDFTGLWAGNIVHASVGRLDKGEIEVESIIDVTHRLKETTIYNWPYGHKIEDLQVPPGDWRLMIMVESKYKQHVGAPARGMEGYVVDHCREECTDFYLANLAEPFIDRIGKGRTRSFFCDSIELGGNNWTTILFTEFYKRRGYDLRAYMPALWHTIGDLTGHIRFDYYKTMSELTIENFFEKFTQWCNTNDSLSRVQAHGTWGDILKVYATADIPEGETFGEGDRYEVNTIHRRLATSAANLYGKEIVSNESFTWLRMPRFLVDLEMIKIAADAIFLDGINHIINHGYSYSPEEKGKPGQVFYASSVISHTNTWWEYYPEVARYIHRVSDFMQMGATYSEVGIYLPQNDIWADTPMAELHMAMKIEEYIGYDTINLLAKHGLWFNYMNDEYIVEGLAAEYKVIILPEIRYMPLETAERLLRFVQDGGVLVAKQHPPKEVPGLLHFKTKQRSFETLMTQLFSTKTGIWQDIGDGSTILVEDDEELLIKLAQRYSPDVRIMDESGSVGYVHKKTDDEDIYFIANLAREAQEVELIFKDRADGFIILDPLTGTVVGDYTILERDTAAGLSMKMSFPPATSYIFIFNDKALPKRNETICKEFIAMEKEISEEWQLEIPEIRFKRELKRIETWEGFSECRYYSGYGIYRKEVSLKKEELEHDGIQLHMDDMFHVADIRINGKDVGVIWKKPHVMNIKDHLVEGVNLLEIKVINLWINQYLDEDREEPLLEDTLIDSWPYFSEIINQTRKKRLYSWREKEMIKDVQPSGLVPPITIKFLSTEG